MNAKNELLETIKDTAKIVCASLTYKPCSPELKFVLPVNYSDIEYQGFINSLDFDYDAGYGGQELYGTVWLEDGTWLSRGEYDGSEWWEHNILPVIPNECV